MIKALAQVIDVIINPLIAVFGILVLIELIVVGNRLKKHAQEVSQKLFAMKFTGVKQSRALDLKQRAMSISKREDLYSLRKTFDELCAKYTTWAQMIPIFPLLGILGTVAGLILQVQAADAAAIYSALGLALSSTFYGLIAAIILKIVEAAVVLSKINSIDNMYSDYEIKYQDQRDINSQSGTENYDEE